MREQPVAKHNFFARRLSQKRKHPVNTAALAMESWLAEEELFRMPARPQ